MTLTKLCTVINLLITPEKMYKRLSLVILYLKKSISDYSIENCIWRVV